jgi:hypothetical protein
MLSQSFGCLGQTIETNDFIVEFTKLGRFIGLASTALLMRAPIDPQHPKKGWG